jgi:CheY-like chemotaxis protein
MTRKLLLADDSVVIQKLVGLSFANESIEILSTDNGDDALLLAREARPDIVLADVVMPGRSGYEVCESIKQDPDLAATPVLLLTGTFEAFDEARARSVGAEGHVTKPFEARGLVDRVNQVLKAAASPRPASPAPTTEGSEPIAILETAPVDDLIEADVMLLPDADADPDFPYEIDLAEEAPLDFGPDRIENEDGDFEFELEAPEPALSTDLATALEAAFEDGLDSMTASPSPQPIADEQPGKDFDDPFAGFDVSNSDLATHPSDAPESRAPSSPASDPLTGSANLFEGLVTGPPLEERQDAFAAELDVREDWLEIDAVEAQSVGAVSKTHDAMDAAAPTEGASDPGLGSGQSFENRNRVDGSGVRDGEKSGTRLRDDPAFAPLFAAEEERVPESPTQPDQRIQEALERVARDAFSDLSDTIVKQIMSRVEQIAWEVIPEMARTLVREEIRRMKNEDD